MMYQLKSVLSGIFILLLFSFPFMVFSDGGEDYCGQKRSLNQLEKNWADSVIKKIQSAFPKVIQDWNLEQKPFRIDLGKSCQKNGNPIELTVKLNYKNDKKLKENTEYLTHNSDKIAEEMQKLVEEMNLAVQKNDAKKIQEIQNKIMALQGASANDLSVQIEVRVNVTMALESNYKSKAFPLSQIKFSYMLDDSQEKKVMFYLGSWRKSGNSVAPVINRKVENHSAQFIEVVIKGKIADLIAKSAKIELLNSLLN